MTINEKRVLDALTAKPMSLLELSSATGMKTSLITGALNILRHQEAVEYKAGKYRVKA